MFTIEYNRDTILFLAVGFALFIFGSTIDTGGLATQNKTSDISYKSEKKEYQYIRVVYIGASDCGFSNSEDTHKSVISIKKSLRELSDKYNFRLITTGISTDSTAHTGIKYLSKTGPYDEIISGGDFYNTGFFSYVWSRDGSPQTPQLHILNQKYDIHEQTIRKTKVLKDIDKKVEVIKSAVGRQEMQNLERIIKKDGDIVIGDEI